MSIDEPSIARLMAASQRGDRAAYRALLGDCGKWLARYFARRIAPVTAHLHLGDAKGLNGEGLQVGDGDIDFDRLGTILKQGCPDATFIPEIWQGHKNGGEGFWVALDRLEGRL